MKNNSFFGLKYVPLVIKAKRIAVVYLSAA